MIALKNNPLMTEESEHLFICLFFYELSIFIILCSLFFTIQEFGFFFFLYILDINLLVVLNISSVFSEPIICHPLLTKIFNFDIIKFIFCFLHMVCALEILFKKFFPSPNHNSILLYFYSFYNFSFPI